MERRPPEGVVSETALDEARLLRLQTKEIPGAPFIAGFHGASAIESWSRLLYKTGRAFNRNFGVDRDLFEISYQSGYSSALLDAVDLILKPNFTLEEYTEGISEALDALDARGRVEGIYCDSVGTLGVYSAMIERVKKGKPVPSWIAAINFLGMGLPDGALWFLEASKQLGEHAIPALRQLVTESEFLENLRREMYDFRDRIPFTLACVCDVGEDFMPCPWGASKNPGIIEKGKKFGFEMGGDGMVNREGAGFFGEVGGMHLSLLNEKNKATLVLKGIPHRGGENFFTPFIAELIQGRSILGVPIPDIRGGKKCEFEVDYSDYLRSRVNKLAEVGMGAVLDFYSSIQRNSRPSAGK